MAIGVAWNGYRSSALYAISKRYFGEESADPVTRQYNASMEHLLPEYGIEFVELPRLKTADGIPISASADRRLAREGAWDSLSKPVPESTLGFLRKQYGPPLRGTRNAR